MKCEDVAQAELDRLANIEILLIALITIIGGEDALPALRTVSL